MQNILKKIDGKKAYITAGLIITIGVSLILLGLYIIEPYGIITGLFFITHGLSVIAFGLNLASERHAIAKLEKKFDLLLEAKK